MNSVLMCVGLYCYICEGQYQSKSVVMRTVWPIYAILRYCANIRLGFKFKVRMDLGAWEFNMRLHVSMEWQHVSVQLRSLRLHSHRLSLCVKKKKVQPIHLNWIQHCNKARYHPPNCFFKHTLCASNCTSQIIFRCLADTWKNVVLTQGKCLCECSLRHRADDWPPTSAPTWNRLSLTADSLVYSSWRPQTQRDKLIF